MRENKTSILSLEIINVCHFAVNDLSNVCDVHYILKIYIGLIVISIRVQLICSHSYSHRLVHNSSSKSRTM